ncbi:MAG: hypothetical protein Q8L21_03130, partial [Candidatus Komeilibacteria bacterium]|nr:hypothetical protein [Candidatus Komeilibacteria bacterium]
MKKIAELTLLLLIVLSPLIPVKAAEFNPHNIISDSEMEELDSLSQDSIQRFLESKNSFLAKFTQVVNGVRKSAAQIIF